MLKCLLSIRWLQKGLGEIYLHSSQADAKQHERKCRVFLSYCSSPVLYCSLLSLVFLYQFEILFSSRENNLINKKKKHLINNYIIFNQLCNSFNIYFFPNCHQFDAKTVPSSFATLFKIHYHLNISTNSVSDVCDLRSCFSGYRLLPVSVAMLAMVAHVKLKS